MPAEAADIEIQGEKRTKADPRPQEVEKKKVK